MTKKKLHFQSLISLFSILLCISSQDPPSRPAQYVPKIKYQLNFTNLCEIEKSGEALKFCQKYGIILPVRICPGLLCMSTLRIDYKSQGWGNGRGLGDAEQSEQAPQAPGGERRGASREAPTMTQPGG